MPFAIKAADLAVSLLNGTSYVLKDHCLPCGNIYLLATAELPGRDKASPVGVSEAGLQPLDYAVFSASPSRLYLFFFSFYYKRLPFIASRKPGALQWISSAESLFNYGAPKVC